LGAVGPNIRGVVEQGLGSACRSCRLCFAPVIGWLFERLGLSAALNGGPDDWTGLP